MTDEEKKALKELTEIKELVEEDLKYEDYNVTATLDQIDLESLVIVLNLIEKQYKEIEELKKPKYIIDCKTNEIKTLTNDFVSKDKIKEKIKQNKELLYSYEKELEEKLHYIDKGSMNCIIAQIQVLQSLLEDLEVEERCK